MHLQGATQRPTLTVHVDSGHAIARSRAEGITYGEALRLASAAAHESHELPPES